MLNADKTEAKSEEFMLESDFGITEYVTTDAAGFSGILKHRFSDFVVHEIRQVIKGVMSSKQSDVT